MALKASGLRQDAHCAFYSAGKITFYFHLEECEFRYNHKNEDIYKLVLKMLRVKSLN